MGAACGLTSCVRVEEDAIAAVDDMTGSSVKGKERIVGKESWILAACTWQESKEGCQHQVRGRRGREERNRQLVTIIKLGCTTAYDSA